ncbi:MAG: glycogen debranching enzyme family protein [Candidatus Dormibacteraeota bacterium]|nr:glycogen debranching enzyme family protein [Candidatus Dormibacteraeota bacterium]
MKMVNPRSAGSQGPLEWLVTNGLGGFASATVAMTLSRRYHALLVAAEGDDRTVVLSRLDDGFDGAALLGFRLELGLPVWTLRKGDTTVERRVVMGHQENAVAVHYRVLERATAVSLGVRPWFDVRELEDDVTQMHSPAAVQHSVDGVDCVFERERGELTVRLRAGGGRFAAGEDGTEQEYPMEAQRGYPSKGWLWSPGHFDMEVAPAGAVFTACLTSAGPMEPQQRNHIALAPERARRERILATAAAHSGEPLPPQLVLAADQFLVTRTPGGAAAPDGVIAGYHWFGRWGRDTMIGLEGLALRTGRWDAAAATLREAVRHVRRGLIPNYFPDHGEPEYHTADATLWMFHALHRYAATTGDAAMVAQLLPVLRNVVAWHVKGTDFSIRVDPADGLLSQGAAGVPLTWMDAKVGDWVVTPRRGKAVELQALWYNALKLLADWERTFGDRADSRALAARAELARTSFNRRFWNPAARCLHDVVDGDEGDDSSCRPNQLFALSLEHPILDEARWDGVLHAVHNHLVTPVGLRTLSPADPAYKPRYDGDRLARDAAYHQGTVWPWLIGPYVDSLRRAGRDPSPARAMAQNLIGSLDGGCAGQLNEIFDAEPPYAPRGCVAQAWSIAELIRSVQATAGSS